jgi:hypothetical protein
MPAFSRFITLKGSATRSGIICFTCMSFENSFYPDYVTEKFYRAVEMGTVSVVFGGLNYSLFAPPHSYINARDFQTPN